MIIDCGIRRIASYSHGWKIEIEKVHKKTHKTYWTEDNPAYPPNLSVAFQMVLERELRDNPDIPIGKLPEALRAAYKAVQSYMDKVAKETPEVVK